MAALAVPREVGVGDLPKEDAFGIASGASASVHNVEGDPPKIMKVVNVPRSKGKDSETKIKKAQDDLVLEVTIQQQLYARVPDSCPAVYDFLHYEPSEGKFAHRYGIVMEKCDKAARLLSSNPGNDDMVLDLLEQIAIILEKAQSELKFNHRDLHPGNVMYKTVDGKKKFLLIDFGFACATIDGTLLETVPDFIVTKKETERKAAERAKKLKEKEEKKKKGKKGKKEEETKEEEVKTEENGCLRTSRDLAMLVYRTRKVKDIVLSETMKAFTQELLTFKLAGQKCDMTVMFEGCMPRFAGTENREYTFLDEDDVENPNTTPTRLLELIKAYRENPQAVIAQLKSRWETAQGSSRTRRTRRRRTPKKQVYRTRRLISSV
jgi:serine/threonine protein kinase